ncbi:YegP family protein (plasmid) [Rhodococcus sp. USK10]|uniref:YegP family protein n=1 Tax=Rhodococcus sp. USK10 TaxID=2789739 RepID=UPI001C5EE58B|nr:YegP family protein [Rhodococcus sp. USK10]QYA99933.1 YegP family protein [Rhodococcus sp. USK10]
MTSKFDLFKDTAGQYRFQLKVANGEIIAASQGYTSKAAAQNGIASIKVNAATAPTGDLT